MLAASVDPGVVRVTLVAPTAKPDVDLAHRDEPDGNLPLLVAVTATVDANLCGYSGLFLTAARRPCYLVVRGVPDTAEQGAKVYFGWARTIHVKLVTHPSCR